MKPMFDPKTHDCYELVDAHEIVLGDVVIDRLADDPKPYVVTAVRRLFHAAGGGLGAVSLFREPTLEEASEFTERTGEDLRAMWACTCVREYPVLRAVPCQNNTKGLAY